MMAASCSSRGSCGSVCHTPFARAVSRMPRGRSKAALKKSRETNVPRAQAAV